MMIMQRRYKQEELFCIYSNCDVTNNEKKYRWLLQSHHEQEFHNQRHRQL